MEVIESNFQEQLPEVLRAISTCDFMAIDSEFSGFGLGGLAILPYDTPALVYDKTKKNISNYTVLQFGLATFSYDTSKKGFRYQAFNFYVFPRLPKSLLRLRGCVSEHFTFSAQADCMDFLASQNFDFNKWIVQGVGYIREAELNKLCEELKRRYTWRMKTGRDSANGAAEVSEKETKIPEQLAVKVKDAVKKISDFMGMETEREMILSDFNVQERRLLFQIIEKDYYASVFAYGQQREGGHTDIILRKCEDVADHDRMQREKLDGELKELENAAGFCKVIKAITDSRKPILGHNVFHDLLHVTRAFCCELPSTYDQFKLLVQQRYKKLIDTKVLAGQNPLKAVAGTGMSLSDLHLKVTGAPFTQIPVEPVDLKYGYTLSNKNLHEAGYDAFLTGLVFIHLAGYMGDQKAPSRQTNDVPWDLLRSLIGKITPGRIIDLPWLSLTTPDLVPDRRHVFHIAFDETKTWSNWEIMQLFSPFGHVFVNWIDAQSAFVSLKVRQQSENVKKQFVDAKMTSNAIHDILGWKLQLATDYFKEKERHLPPQVDQVSQEPAQSDSSMVPLEDDEDANGTMKRVRCS